LSSTVVNDDAGCGRDCVYLGGIGRLADNATPGTAQDEMTGIAAALEKAFPNENTNVTVMVQTLQDRTVGSVQLALMVHAMGYDRRLVHQGLVAKQGMAGALIPDQKLAEDEVVSADLAP